MSWDPNQLEQQRLSKLELLKEAGIDPFPIHVDRTHSISEAVDQFLELEQKDSQDSSIKSEEPLIVTGRLLSLRDMGKTVFADIEDGSGRIQLFIRRNDIGEESHNVFRKMIDIGDFVQAKGIVFRTRMGEISVRVSEWKVLSKAITPLPFAKEQEVDGEIVRYSAFADVEERYRQRYADLGVNPEVRDVFRTRARILSTLRRFFDNHDFLEVETPIMQPIYGGAAARPIITN